MAARGKMKANVQRLTEERNRLLEQMEALKHRIGGLELAISLLEKDGDDQPSGTSGRGKAKELLIDLLREVGTTGLNATIAVEIAQRRGRKLARGTAASTLSRLKVDGIAVYDNDRYRLTEFVRPKMAVVAGIGTVAGVAAVGAAGTIKNS